MAIYPIKPQNTYGGPWATTPAQCAAGTPAKWKQVDDWMTSASLAGASQILLDASGGPFTLADTQDYPPNIVGSSTDTALSMRTPIDLSTTNITKTGAFGRNLCFGNITADQNGATPSKADGFTFTAQGQDGPGQFNIDMQALGGVTTNANRQQAAVLIQGRSVTIEGFRIRCSNWNFTAPGRIQSTAIGPANGGLAGEASRENYGLNFRGCWNSVVRDCYVDGGLFGTRLIEIGVRAYDPDPTWNQGATLRVHDCTTVGGGRSGLRVHYMEGATSSLLPLGVDIEVYNCLARDMVFYSTTYNGSIAHANLMAFGGTVRSGRFAVHDNEVYGACQDGLVMVSPNGDLYNNHVHDLNPTVPYGASTGTYMGGSGGSWVNTTIVPAGEGIKTGLTGNDGTAPAGWLAVGTPGGAFGVDESRVRVFRNRVVNAGYYCITNNGSSGMLIAANECDNSMRSGRCLQLNPGDIGNSYVINNYFHSQDFTILVPGYGFIYFFNNIVNTLGSSCMQVLGSNIIMHGSNNLFRNAGRVYGSGASASQIKLQNSRFGVPDYVVGVGPTAGGNCVSAGDWGGIVGARSALTWRDINGTRWKRNRLPIGPRQP